MSEHIANSDLLHRGGSRGEAAATPAKMQKKTLCSTFKKSYSVLPQGSFQARHSGQTTLSGKKTYNGVTNDAHLLKDVA